MQQYFSLKKKKKDEDEESAKTVLAIKFYVWGGGRKK